MSRVPYRLPAVVVNANGSKSRIRHETVSQSRATALQRAGVRRNETAGPTHVGYRPAIGEMNMELATLLAWDGGLHRPIRYLQGRRVSFRLISSDR